MVTIKGYEKRTNSDGEEFFILVLQGGVTPVKSKETGRIYFTANTATATSTFDEETCKEIIGTQFPGRIAKKKVEPYEYTIPETGEVLMLEHRWEYQDEVLDEITEQLIDEKQVV
ncbi:hypothetical protein [Pseudotenacibaculum haliotis]|uniref:Uncharacterized protein n=1 Tax=Pseudotenacibaculum haliotis TaxID=1862138 RepID=A0ABW5LWS7_9FLAO